MLLPNATSKRRSAGSVFRTILILFMIFALVPISMPYAVHAENTAGTAVPKATTGSSTAPSAGTSPASSTLPGTTVSTPEAQTVPNSNTTTPDASTLPENAGKPDAVTSDTTTTPGSATEPSDPGAITTEPSTLETAAPETIAAPPAASVNTEQIDTYIKESMDNLHIPGVSIAIVKGDQLLYQNGYGLTGIGKESVTAQTPFVLGSVSKSFTALAVMQLVDQGKIDLEAPVQKYLPWFRVADKQASKQLLVKHLLNQTSGLSTYDGRVSLAEGNQSLEQNIRSLSQTKLTKPVGTTFQYSNLNYDILGGIIEKVSGMSYGKYIEQHIFTPLGMNHSYSSPTKAKNSGLTSGYQPIFGLMLPTQQANHEATIPSGYLVSSVEDMSKYVMAQINKGKFGTKPLVSEQSAALMHAPSAHMWGNSYYGMGWTINKENGRIYHDGSTENTYSKMIIDGDYGIILLANSVDYIHMDAYDQISDGIIRIVHGEDGVAPVQVEYKRDFLIVDGIALAIVIYLIWSLGVLILWFAKFKPTVFRVTFNILSITVINAVLPLAVLYVLPKFLVPWPVIFIFHVGLGQFVYYACYALLGIGAIKALFLIISMLKSKLTRKAPEQPAPKPADGAKKSERSERIKELLQL